MRLILFFSFTFLTVNHFANAQIRATTESGNKVLLFDDGTWRYDESRAVGTSAAVVAPTAKNDFSIDSTRVFETNVEDLFFQSSPRLTKFFGVDGSSIRCKVSCSNTKGLLRLHFRWEFPVGDGNRYFGMMKEGSKVSFGLENGQMIDLFVEGKSQLTRKDKFNYSMLNCVTQTLTKAQVSSLLTHPIRKVEVEWKKNAEKYDVDHPRLLIEALPEAF
jgi:hypothetical protein